MTDAHKQAITHHYTVVYPDHAPRESDPHYVDFEAYRRKTQATAVCAFAVATGVSTECDTTHPLELHHSHVEFALQNGIDLAVLERDYPGISDPANVGAWVESAANLEWLCLRHHRGHAGKHSAAFADYEAQRYVRGLIE